MSVYLLVFMALAVAFHIPNVSAFSVWNTRSLNRKTADTHQRLKASTEICPDKKIVHIEAIGCAGLTEEELPIALSAAAKALHGTFGIEFMADNVYNDCNPAVPESVPGATGRVILLSLNNVADDWALDDERLEPFKNAISQQIDALVGNGLHQPILISVQPSFRNKHAEIKVFSDILAGIVEREVLSYGLRCPMVVNSKADAYTTPKERVEIDGAMVPDPYTDEEHFDTSSVLVFDNFVDSELRERLLDVINKRNGDGARWDDKTLGPDPKRWIRGGEESNSLCEQKFYSTI
jgi:hypothetical protein